MQQKCNDNKNIYKKALKKFDNDKKILKNNNSLIINPTATITIGEVKTGASGSQVAAYITGTSPNLILNLTIPQGPTGPSA